MSVIALVGKYSTSLSGRNNASLYLIKVLVFVFQLADIVVYMTPMNKTNFYISYKTLKIVNKFY